jgi:uncharacterized protein
MMASNHDNEQQVTLIEFPCEFPIKVMGETHVDFSTEIIKTIQLHETTFDASKVDIRASSGGKYTSLTCTCYVESKLQLDNIYRALTSHPMVKFVL